MHLGNRFIIKISNKFPLSIRKILEFRKILYVNSRVKSRNGKSSEIVDSAERKRPGAQRPLNWNNVTMISSCKEKKTRSKARFTPRACLDAESFPFATELLQSRTLFKFLDNIFPFYLPPSLQRIAPSYALTRADRRGPPHHNSTRLP